jgi:hypothetical protein
MISFFVWAGDTVFYIHFVRLCLPVSDGVFKFYRKRNRCNNEVNIKDSISCSHKKADHMRIMQGKCDAVEYQVPVEITVEQCGKTTKSPGTVTHTQIKSTCSCVDATKKCADGAKKCDDWKHCGHGGFPQRLRTAYQVTQA